MISCRLGCPSHRPRIWLASAGTGGRAAQRQMHPARFGVAAPGAATPVCVTGPRGRVGDLLPTWTSTTDLGSDTPGFATPRSPV
jgi:hypothetical protein